MTEIKSPIRYLVIIGRTYASGTEEDSAEVNALQAKYEVMPLSAHDKPYTFIAPQVDPNPGFSMTDKPQQAIAALDISAYFDMMAKLMGGAAPPAPDDAPIVARMARIGIVPGQAFDITKLDPAPQAALKTVPNTATERSWRSKAGPVSSGTAGSYRRLPVPTVLIISVAP